MPVQLIANRALPAAATGGMTSTVGEPSLGQAGDELFFTGNWFAAARRGGVWTAVDPFTFLPPAGFDFCCDQTVIAVPSHGILCWLLQYSTNQQGTNSLRVAVAAGDFSRRQSWHWWDFRPSIVDPSWSHRWFDYNHAATTARFLHVGTNLFHGEDWVGYLDLRLPLAELAAGGTLTFERFFTDEVFSLRCTAGAATTMYLGSHRAANGRPADFSVFRWADDETQVQEEVVQISPWSASGTYVAPCPDGRNWLDRCDSRVTAGWVEGNRVGFAWTANRRGSRPLPHVRAVRIDTTTWQRVDEPDIWSSSWAYAFPDAQPGANDALGLTLFRGGGPVFPGHVVGHRGAAGNWELQATRNGTATANDGKWGDYLTCRLHPQGQFLASGYTLQGGGDRSDIQPRVVEFR